MRKTKLALLAFAIVQTASALSAGAATPGKIALVQYHVDSFFGVLERNTATLRNYAEAAVAKGANIVVFPEGSITGYDNNREIWCLPGVNRYHLGDGVWRRCRSVGGIAEAVPAGKTTQYWREFAIAKKIYLVFSLIEQDGDKYYNTIVALSPEGEATKYRKRALYTVDQAYAERGPGPTVLETPYGRFGLLICLDGIDTPEHFEEDDFDFGFYREYTQLNVDAILIPMNWSAHEPNDPWSAKQVFQKRARFNRLDIYAADAWDGTGKYRSQGGARERNGLPDYPVGKNGISYHELRY